MRPRLWIMCATANGIDLARLLHGRVPVHGLIGLSGRPATEAISNLARIADVGRELGVETVEVDRYDLKSDTDRTRLMSHDMDVLVLAGWQRLVPEWLLTHCRLAAIGIHGSARGIAGGRGRSPQNWALLMGDPSFEVSIFFARAGADDGPVIASRKFPLTPMDDIRSSHYKVSLCAADMIVEALTTGALADGRAVEQPRQAYYLPQRRPEDGALDWSRSAHQLYDFVRALTRPYPGAFSLLGEATVRIWRGRPVETPGPMGQPGEVVARLGEHDFVVATGNGLFLVDDWEAMPEIAIRVGDILSSVIFVEQMRRIVDRHYAIQPDAPLCPSVLELAGLGRRIS